MFWTQIRWKSFLGRDILSHFLGGLELFTAEFHLYSQLFDNFSLRFGFLIHEVLPLVLQEGGAFFPAFWYEKVAILQFVGNL